MVNVTHLLKQRAAEFDAAQAILAKADSEKRALTADETSAYDAHLSTIDGLTATIERSERAAKLGATINSGTANANARTPHVEVHDNAVDKPFANFGEFLLSVRTAATSPSQIDPRLIEKRAPLGLNEAVGSEGGFLVQKETADAILEEAHDVGVLAPLCAAVPIGANTNGITINGVDETSRVDGSRFGGVQSYWAAEAGSVTATKPKMRQIDLKLNKLMAVYYTTDELLQDSSALGSLAQRAFAEEMAFKVDDAIIRGTGAGMPQGILNANVTVSVSKETGQTAATVLYENLVKMYARMPARSKRTARWFINDDVFPQLQLMTLPGGVSQTPVWLPANGAADMPFGSIFGRPIEPIEQCATLGTVGDIVFADFSQYLLATKGGLQSAQSMHVQFLTAEQVFRFIFRVDGQPARQSALTPFKGSSTLSPFVTLATRA